MIGYVALGFLIATLTAFGTGFVYGGKGPRNELATLKAQMVAAKKQREAEDENANVKLRARSAESFAALRIAQGIAAAAQDEAARTAAQLRAAGVGCDLPGAARIVFDRAAGRGSAAQVRSSAPDAAASPGGASAGSVDAGTLAPRPGDVAPVDSVTLFEVGTRNTSRALFNAIALVSCQRDLVALWEAATGQTYPTRELAPWLTTEAP